VTGNNTTEPSLVFPEGRLIFMLKKVFIITLMVLLLAVGVVAMILMCNKRSVINRTMDVSLSSSAEILGFYNDRELFAAKVQIDITDYEKFIQRLPKEYLTGEAVWDGFNDEYIEGDMNSWWDLEDDEIAIDFHRYDENPRYVKHPWYRRIYVVEKEERVILYLYSMK